MKLLEFLCFGNRLHHECSSRRQNEITARLYASIEVTAVLVESWWWWWRRRKKRRNRSSPRRCRNQ